MVGKQRAVQREVVGLTKDGRPLVIELMLDSITDDTTGGTTLVGVLHDITGVPHDFFVIGYGPSLLGLILLPLCLLGLMSQS